MADKSSITFTRQTTEGLALIRRFEEKTSFQNVLKIVTRPNGKWDVVYEDERIVYDTEVENMGKPGLFKKAKVNVPFYWSLNILPLKDNMEYVLTGKMHNREWYGYTYVDRDESPDSEAAN